MTEERYDASIGSFSADPPNAPDRTVSEPPSSESNLLPEIMAPTAVSLRIERGIQADRARSVTVALTAEALWIQDVWQLRQVPLATLTTLEVLNNGKELLLNRRPEVSAERLRLTFDSAAEGLHWFNTLGKQQQQLSTAAPARERFVPEGVTLVGQAPAVPHVSLGPVGFTGRTSSSADRGTQLRAAMLGADAVIEVERWKCREMGWDARQVRGVAVRVEDAIDRQRLRWCWFSENVCALFNRMLLLLAVQAVLLFLLGLFGAGASNVHAASGETRSEALTSAGMALALLYVWPLVILALLRVLCQPELLRTAGLAVLTVTTGRGLLVMLVHGLVVQKTGSEWAGKTLWLMLDPFDWAIIICGARLCMRAWRLASAARDILPPESQVLTRAGRLRSCGLVGVTVLYAGALLGFIGYSRYQLSSFLPQPGVDTRLEQEALSAFNDGRAHLEKAELVAAEKSFQTALLLFEKLTSAKSVPVAYRYDLFLTLWNLAWISERLDRRNEAESRYKRAVTIGEAIVGHPEAEKELWNQLESARQGLESLRQNRLVVVLTEKDQTATRKYEEFQVQYKKEPAEAEKL